MMDEFIQKAMSNSYKLFELLHFCRDNTHNYHVIVHESAFQSFLRKINSDTVPYEAREHGNHVHFLVLSKYPFEGDKNILSRSLEIGRDNDYRLFKRLFKSSRKKLNFFCKFTFENPSLQEMAMNKILSNLRNLHDLKQLNLPFPLMKNLFQRAKSHFQLPEWDGKTVLENTDISTVDPTYDSEFVIRYQNTENIFTSRRFLVENYFEIKGIKETVKMCLECMKFERKTGSYCRNFRYLNNTDLSFLNSFVTDAWNWCHACKCVPLFQTLTDKEMNILYRVNPFDLWISKKTVLHKAYFKDGVPKFVLTRGYFKDESSSEEESDSENKL